MESKHLCMRLAASTLIAGSVFAAPARVQGSAQDLAKKLSNPVAALSSVPMQLNYDQNIGPVEGGQKWVLNLQPVGPIDLNADWNLISRTILPIVSR
jgi:hypothetical protein